MNGSILVTGAQGFVGRYFIAAVARRVPGCRIVGIGRSERRDAFTHAITLGERSVPATILDADLALPETAEYRRIDITGRPELVALLRDVRPAIVVHLASGLRDDHFQHLVRTNVEGTVTLLEAIAESGIAVERIVLGSSGSVYGSAAVRHPVLDESLPGEPADLYAVSKLASEHAATVVARERALPIVIARIFNVVGAGQEERHVVGRFASQIAAIERGASPQMRIGDLSPLRDFIDVRDVASGLIDLAERGVPGERYNLATGVATPIARILDLLIEIAALDGRVELDRSYVRPADVPRFVANIARISALGFVPRHTLRESIEATLAYYRKAFDVTALASAAASSAATHG